MKDQANKLLLFVLVLAIAACWHLDRESSTLRLQYTENEEEYRFIGQYNKNRTAKVYNFIEENLQDNHLFGRPQKKLRYLATLKDNTKIYITAKPGKLKIVLKKDDNTHSQYLKIKRVCEELNVVLK
jgi:hypothetical protein